MAFYDAFYDACRKIHREIVDLMIAKRGNDWDWGLRNACHGGHLEIVQLMITNGGNHDCTNCSLLIVVQYSANADSIKISNQHPLTN